MQRWRKTEGAKMVRPSYWRTRPFTSTSTSIPYSVSAKCFSKLPSYVGAVCLIVCLSFLWTVVLPGALAIREHVFDSRDVRVRLSQLTTTKSASLRLDRYEKDRQRYEAWLGAINAKIDAAVTSKSPPNDLKALLDSRQRIEEEQAALQPPVVVAGFFKSGVNYVFLIHYLFLGFLLLLAPISWRRLRVAPLLSFGLLGYTVFEWPNWVRNFVMNRYISDTNGAYEKGRVVFSFPHWDISHTQFYLQEARVLGMFLLLSVLWQAWFYLSQGVGANAKSWKEQPLNFSDAGVEAVSVSDEFSRWQINSILLAGAFIPWTWFYWSSVHSEGDNRYLINAIIIHLIWGLSWLLLSAPFLISWRAWSRLKLIMLCEALAVSEDDGAPGRTVQFFSQVEPLSNMRLVGASLVAATSFILPLIQLVR